MSSLPEKTRLPAVFLSYAREDAGAARRLADALRAAGIEVWFDQNELRGGDEWDRTIRRQIRECALFVPVISANTQVRTEGYFRLEWHLAEQRSLLMARGRPFLVPVCIDATAERDALVAEAFLAVHWTRLTDGEALAAFVQRMTGLLRGNTPVRAAGSGTAAPTTARAAGAAPPGAPRIADYELLRVIGRGSYGDVWLARGVTGIYRAIKVVWRERFADAGPFEREFKGLTEFAAISLGESIQMALLHIGRNDDAGYFYYVMELADDVDRGREIVPASYAPLTLTEARKRRGRLPTAECVGIGVELARVLAGLHRRGLIHRDIKPSNIIFVGGVAKLADIGLVTAATDASTFVGTEGFVPPEGPGSASADVFALGKLLYELATGLHRQEFPQLPAEVNRLPDAKALFEFNEIILRACEPDRAKRYGTADAMLADLRALQAGISLRQRRVGKKVLRFGAAAAAVVVSAAGVWWKSSWPASPDRSAAAATPAPAVPIAAEKSIAVLPFANLSDEKADAYFADGVHAEIISSLAKIIQLRVVSNSSVRPYRESKKSLGQIAQELGVVYLLEGDVQRANDRVRVSGRLILAATGAVIWADKFERALADIFSLQSELSQIIAEKLQAKLAPEEKKQLITDPTKSLAAYDLFLRARSLSVREDDYSGANTKQMEDLYTQAVGLDPDFTEAWVNLADIQILRGKNVDEARQQEQEKKARASLEQVKRLAPNSSDLEKELGYFFLILHKDYDRALRHFREALRLKPSSPWALAGVATVLYRQGDWTGSTAMAQRASKLDPGDIQLRRQIAYCLEWMRRFPEAAEQVRRIMEIIGENLSDRYVVVLDQFLASGDTGPAEAFFAGLTAAEREIEDVNDMAREWARITGNFAEVGRLDRLAVPMPGAGRDNDGAATNAAFALAALGDLPTARARLADWPKKFRERAPERNGNYFITLARAARMEALLGHRDVALDYVRRAAEGVPETRDAIWNWSISYNNAITLAWLGDKDGAIAALGRLLRTAGGSTSIIVARDAAFFPLRGDPRFEALMADPATHAPIPWSPDPNQPEPMPKLVTAAVPSSKSMVSVAAVAAPAALASNQKSIAVLPFENMSEDKAANAFFADGMQEDILTNLGVVRALRVTSRTSVMQYRATTKTARQIGAELGVAYLLEGSVRRAGGRVRVTGQLIDTRTDEHVWAKAYDRDLADIFSLQSELAQEIAGALSAVISPQEKTLLDTRPTTNLAAYDRYLGARAAKTDEEAEKLLLEAVALDPDFADAWALLVNRHAWNYFIGADRGKPARLAMAKVALDTTVRLAPGSTAAIVAQGDYCYYGLREYEQAAGHYQRSLALRPNSAMALEFFGYCCRRLGRWGEAVASLRQASKLNPNDPNLARNVTDLLWGVRRYAEAAAEYLHLAELEPASANPRFRSVLMTFYATGSTREVDEWFARQPAPAAAEAEPQWAQQRRWLRARGDFTEAFRFDQQHPPKKEPGLLPKIAALFDLLGTGEAAAAKAQAGTLLPEIDTLIAQERKLPGQDPYHWETLARGATLHAIAGDPATARGLGREFLALRARRPDAWVDPRVRNQYAQILALAGEKDLALAELAQSLRMPYGANVHLVRHDPAWRPFRGDPRFEALLADPKNNAPLF